MTLIKILFIFLFFSLGSNAQSIIIKDQGGTVVNNDTLLFSPGLIQKPPYTEISCYLFPQNISSTAMNMRAKKTDILLASDATNSFCFAGVCYSSIVFISPGIVSLPAGAIDSDFSGHYLYPDTHTAGIDLVAYTFYNDANNSDSAIVYVRYHSIPATALPINEYPNLIISTYPNPANNSVNFLYNIPYNTKTNTVTFSVINSIGQIISTQTLTGTNEVLSLNTSIWEPGMYFYSCIYNDKNIGHGAFIISH